MRYDDPQRPRTSGADATMLQINGSPLPVIYLIRPMESEESVTWECGGRDSGLCHGPIGSDCSGCVRSATPVWGWLASAHCHVEGARFSYHTAFIADLARFSSEWLEDPEACLARYFKYHGPDQRAASVARRSTGVVIAEDALWGD